MWLCSSTNGAFGYKKKKEKEIQPLFVLTETYYVTTILDSTTQLQYRFFGIKHP